MANTRFAYTNRLESAALLNGAAVVTGAINQWSNGSANVTRASGSYITDGVKAWSTVGGTLATKFPATTRVQSVSALTLVLTAAATAGGSGTDSGSFTPTFALEENASFPTSKAQDGQRYIPWLTGAAPASPLTVEYDLGSSLACSLAAALAIPPIVSASTTRITSVEVEYTDTYGSGWTSAGSFSPNSLTDKGMVFASQTKRFWRFKFTNSGQFVVGELWLGVPDQDMGAQYSPGTIRGHRKNRTLAESSAGIRQHFYHSRNLHQWTLDYNVITETMRAKLDTLFQQQRSFLFIDENDNVYQVESTEDAWGAEAVFTSVDNSRLVIEELV